jgi:predicted anti-sigma-YlaC factor YlaD
MPHIDDLTLMMYGDNELSAEEAARVEDHLAHCFHCRQSWEQMAGEQRLLAETVFAADTSLPPLELDSLTAAQIEGIAILHRRHRRRLLWRAVLGTSALLAVAAGYLIFWQSVWFHWVSSAWNSWTSRFFWGSALWLKDNAGDLFDVPGAYVVALPLPLLLLIGLLLLVNIRFHPFPPSRLRNREVD